MIVKVQISIDGKRKLLVYDEGQTFRFESELDPDTELLMGGRAKAFFYARVDAQRRIVIEGGAPWQEW
jgi:hypothetical protein